MSTSDSTSRAAPPVPKLLDWPEEAVVHYLLLRARKMTQPKAAKATREQYALKAGLKTQPQCSHFEREEDVVAYLAYLRADLKSNLSKLPYAQKWERIADLGRLILALYDRFEAEDELGVEANVTSLTKVSAEIRQLHQAVRVEVEGEGIDSTQVLATIEQLAKRRREIIESSDHSERAEKLLAN